LRDVVKNLLPKEENAPVPVSDSMAILRRRLLKIKEYCGEYNKKDAKKLFKELNSHSWQQETKDFLNDMSARLLHSEFEEMSEDIDKFLESIQ
jgi:hypothetical protein